MNTVKALQLVQVQCGKRVVDSKRRFKWIFEIGSTKYELQLASSAISGKKRITLNGNQIYIQKNIMNLNFDFTYTIQGHIVRITKKSNVSNLYDLRIDNKNFLDLKGGSNHQIKTETKIQEKQQYDPFAEFSNNQNMNTCSQNNDFGQFDLDWKSTATVQKQNIQDVGNINFTEQPKCEQIKFQTNADIFQTKTPQANINNIDAFMQNFLQNEKKFITQEQFATNCFVNTSKYVELARDVKGRSQYYSELANNQNDPNMGRPQQAQNMKQMKQKMKLAGKQFENKINKISESLI